MSMIVRIELGVVEIELPDDASVHVLDRDLEERIKEVQRAAFSEACSQIEAGLLKERTCPSCGGVLTVSDVDHRSVVMLAGAVSVPVRRLRCKECKARSAPLAAFLPEARHTLPVTERALRLATELGYAKSSDLLARLTGATVSHEQIRRFALSEATRIGVELERETDELFSCGVCPPGCVERDGQDTVVVAMDGGLVADRATGERFEARVGVVWSGVADVSEGRRTLLGRTAHAGIEDTATFARKMSTLAVKAGMTTAGTTIVIGDGAGWIRRTARDWFPDAVYVLDLYHLKRRISELFSREKDAAWRERVLSECVAGRPHAAVRILRSYDPGPDDRVREVHRRLINYITVNAEGIRNYTRTDLFGSGSVEKAVDVLVSRRLKCRGMSWLKPGALGILKLKLLRFNNEWDAHWESRFADAA
jgi:hypothetical protein